jgi:hypothetical protein
MIIAIIPWGIHNTSQYLGMEYLYFVYVACGCTPPELDAIRPENGIMIAGDESRT